MFTDALECRRDILECARIVRQATSERLFKRQENAESQIVLSLPMSDGDYSFSYLINGTKQGQRSPIYKMGK